jgi:integrase
MLSDFRPSTSDFPQPITPLQPLPGQLGLWLEEPAQLPVVKRTRKADDTFLLDDSSSLMARLERDFWRLNLKIKSKRTRDDYRSLVRGFSRWYFVKQARLPRPEDLDEDTLSSYASDTLESKTVGADKMNTYLAYLRRLARVLCKRALEASIVPTLTHDVRAWNDEQVQLILDQAAAKPGRCGQHAACDWWEALVLTMLSTAGRIGAVLSIRAADVDLARGLIKLPAEGQKQRKDETKRLLPEATDVLRRILSELPPGTELLFAGCGHQRRWVEEQYEALLLSAGLPAGRKEKFHNLRRYVATNVFIQAGNDIEAVRRFLGHSSTKISWKYIDMSRVPEQVMSVVDAVPRFKTRTGPRIFRAS